MAQWKKYLEIPFVWVCRSMIKDMTYLFNLKQINSKVDKTSFIISINWIVKRWFQSGKKMRKILLTNRIKIIKGNPKFRIWTHR
jgi:hypothetical protein